MSLPTFYAGQNGHEFLCSRPEHSGIQHCANIPDSRDAFTRAQCSLALDDWAQLVQELRVDRVPSCVFLPHRPSRLEVSASILHGTNNATTTTNNSSSSSTTTTTTMTTTTTKDSSTASCAGCVDGTSVECSATLPVATLHVRFLATTIGALNASIASAPEALRKLVLSERPLAAQWRRTGGHNASASGSSFPLVDCINWNRYYVDCNASAKNPFMGATSFDNIGLAWVAIFQVISMEGWSDILYLLQDTFR